MHVACLLCKRFSVSFHQLQSVRILMIADESESEYELQLLEHLLLQFCIKRTVHKTHSTRNRPKRTATQRHEFINKNYQCTVIFNLLKFIFGYAQLSSKIEQNISLCFSLLFVRRKIFSAFCTGSSEFYIKYVAHMIDNVQLLI